MDFKERAFQEEQHTCQNPQTDTLSIIAYLDGPLSLCWEATEDLEAEYFFKKIFYGTSFLCLLHWFLVFFFRRKYRSGV